MPKTFCLNCDEEQDYYIVTITKEFDVKGVKVIADIEEVYCSKCNNKVFLYKIERNNQIKVFDAYKKATGLLTSKEIINIRKKYNLTQSELARLIRCGEKNIARYENGAIQDQSIDLLIRMVKEHPDYFGIVDYNRIISESLKGIVFQWEWSFDDEVFQTKTKYLSPHKKQKEVRCDA